MTDDLLAGFLSPPESAKPLVWWHWMNGNITKEGIRKDLEWMKRIGIGGVQTFDGALDTPQIVKERLAYMTPQWQDAFQYATRLADELGLELGIASSPGWSETGGPWVQPRDGMKKIVWSETHVTCERPLTLKLAAPPFQSGPFQSLPRVEVFADARAQVPDYYEDIATLAYRTPRMLLRDPEPVVFTCSAPEVDVRPLLANDMRQLVTMPIRKDRPAWVLYDYGTPQRFRSVALGRSCKFNLMAFRWLIEASEDGQRFDAVTELPGEQLLHHVTVSFPAVTARYLRLKVSLVPAVTWFELAANAPGADFRPGYADVPQEVGLYALRFRAGARVHRFEEKAAFAIAPAYDALECIASEPAEVVGVEGILDVTHLMGKDGALEWTPPAGEWTVLRLGYSLTGKTNHPASPEATGLEVDKLDREAVATYLEAYLRNFERTVGREWMGAKGIRALLTDSIETSGQNWTPNLIAEFRARRGYDPLRWLPTLTGVVVGDAGRTDQFLWDFRKTLIELISEAHYGQIAESVHARGMLYYSESLEGHPTAALGDDLDMRIPADVPMAAVWTNYNFARQDGILNHIVDMRGAASVAHVMGRQFVAAESLTSAYEPWAFSPATLKPTMDLAFALGVNRPVIHTSVHQPTEKKPGVTLGPFGQHFTRHETWAEMAGPWITYLARCSFLLQQGKPVADVAWFYGEEGSLAGLYAQGAPADLPKGYGFDFVNGNMLLRHLSAKDGQLVSTGGARYRLLYLGGNSLRMTLSVLRRLKSLADAGVQIAGHQPLGSPSLADAGHEREYRGLVSDLWGSGRIKAAGHPDNLLANLGLVPDFECGPGDAHVLFLHRSLPEGELYFLTNRKAHEERVEAHFRVAGRKPELWHADTGVREPASWKVEGHVTNVPLSFRASESLFVVFGNPTDQIHEETAAPQDQPLATLSGDWRIQFESHCGAAVEVVVRGLESWTLNVEPAIRFFSGVGTYRKQFTVEPSALRSDGRVLLDLGEVHELAEVILNGVLIGTAWHAPFQLDVTGVIRAGVNTLEVRVANLWVNRLIGDKQPGITPSAFTTTTTYRADAPLRPSGLLGPVVLKRRTA